MGLSRYLIKPLLMVIPALLGVTIITFTLKYLFPGNPAIVKDAQLFQSFVPFVSVVYVMVNLIVDIAYAVADPRIRLR